MQAMACIDTAVWDAVGKALGQPLWRLWGGYRDRIPMIGIGGYYIPDDGAPRARRSSDEIDFFQGEHGMVGMKFKVGAQRPAEDAARLRRARDHAGDDFLFVVDANQGYTVPEALDFLAAVRAEGIELRWFEEPTRWHADFRGLRDVALLRGNVAVAAGQSEISRVGMREMMVAGAIDVCNYDASWGGGPSEWRRIAALAAAFDVQLGHHEEAQVAAHLLASQPHGTYVEAFSPTRDPIFWQMLENRPALVDGQFPLPAGPGLGWVLDEAFIDRTASIVDELRRPATAGTILSGNVDNAEPPRDNGAALGPGAGCGGCGRGGTADADRTSAPARPDDRSQHPGGGMQRRRRSHDGSLGKQRPGHPGTGLGRAAQRERRG